MAKTAVLNCEPIQLGCEVCYTNTSTYDSVMCVTLGLSPHTIMYLWVTDKFGNQYRDRFQTNTLGQLVLNTIDFPDGMFNTDAGTFDIFISSDILGVNIIPFTVLGITYTCLKFNTVCEEVPSYILQENGSYLLQENGYRILI